MMKPTAVTLLGALLVLATIAPALTQQAEPTAREQALMKKIDELERRLLELERRSGVQPAPAEQPQPKKPQGEGLRSYWQDGLKFESADGAVKMQAGTLIQADAAFVSRPGGGAGGWAGGTEFRRARLSLAGQVRDRVDFKAEYDFGNGDGTARVKDVYVGLVNLPAVGSVRLGHFKEPFSLETLTSDSWITFMERPLAVNAFSPDRNMGLMLQNSAFGDRMTWAAGLFHDTDDFGKGLCQNLAFTTRVTGLPWQKGDARLLHLGVGFSHRALPGTVTFASTPEAHLAPKCAATPAIAAKSDDLLGAEAALLLGRGSLQSEYVNALVHTKAAGSPGFFGYYVTGSYFLTGDHRVYRRSNAVFDRVRPAHNFRDGKGGWGAWEAAVRYSHLNLNNGALVGGKLDDITLGLNWYLNPTTRISCNYVIANPSNTAASRILEMRSQLSF